MSATQAFFVTQKSHQNHKKSHNYSENGQKQAEVVSLYNYDRPCYNKLCEYIYERGNKHECLR